MDSRGVDCECERCCWVWYCVGWLVGCSVCWCCRGKGAWGVGFVFVFVSSMTGKGKRKARTHSDSALATRPDKVDDHSIPQRTMTGSGLSRESVAQQGHTTGKAGEKPRHPLLCYGLMDAANGGGGCPHSPAADRGRTTQPDQVKPKESE